MEDEEFAKEMEEEVKEDVEDEVEDTDWAPHEDSVPSTEDYSSQSEEVPDGIGSSNTVRYSSLQCITFANPKESWQQKNEHIYAYIYRQKQKPHF